MMSNDHRINSFRKIYRNAEVQRHRAFHASIAALNQIQSNQIVTRRQLFIESFNLRAIETQNASMFPYDNSIRKVYIEMAETDT